MDITTANRLYELRKQHGYSQDELAEMLNVSRQAVSKWERSESSPDTDNLIALARLYNVSLDQLLGFDINNDENEDKTSTEETDEGVHIEDGKKHVHIDNTGIHVQDKNGESVHITGNIAKFVNKVVGEVHVNDNDNDNDDDDEHEEFSIKNGHITGSYGKLAVKGIVFATTLLISLAVYLAIGFTCKLWHPGWLLFFLPMIAEGFTDMIQKRDPNLFPIVIIAPGTYLLLGFLIAWHPYWAVLFAIPAYYIIVSQIKKAVKAKNDNGITIEIARSDENVVENDD